MNKKENTNKSIKKKLLTSVAIGTILTVLSPAKINAEEESIHYSMDEENVIEIITKHINELYGNEMELPYNNEFTVKQMINRGLSYHYGEEFQKATEVYSELLSNDTVSKLHEILEELNFMSQEKLPLVNYIDVLNESYNREFLDNTEENNTEIDSNNEEDIVNEDEVNQEEAESTKELTTPHETQDPEELTPSDKNETNLDEANLDQENEEDSDQESVSNYESDEEVRLFSNANTKTADELYSNVMNASGASAAWRAAQNFKEAYPTDSRLASAIESAANRIAIMGRNNHRRGNYAAAMGYYTDLLNEPLIPEDLRTEISTQLQQASASLPLMTSDEMYDAVINASGASAAWRAAQNFKEAFPTDSRLASAIESAANRIAIMGRNSHRRENYSGAIDYYTRLLNEPLISEEIRTEISTQYQQASASLPLMTSDEMYDAVINASGASAAWRAAQSFKETFPNDSRLTSAIESAANRIAIMGRNNHRRGNYAAAIDYYTDLLNESLIPEELRSEIATQLQQANASLPLMTSDEMYDAVINASGASAAWRAAQNFKETFPNDSRLTLAVEHAANRIAVMGRNYHRRGNFTAAIDYYTDILNEPLTNDTLKAEIEIYYSQALSNETLMMAGDMYDAVINASGASAAWRTAQNFKETFPTDSRVAAAINNAANRIYNVGIGAHRRRNYSDAISYYNLLLGEELVNNSMSNRVRILVQQANQNSLPLTADDYYNQSVASSSASGAWNVALEGLSFYPNNSRINDALNKAANRTLKLGRSQQRIGNKVSARDYFTKVMNESKVDSSIRTLASVFEQQTAPNYKHTVYIDAGHGGSDPGASFGGVNEKVLNLNTSLLLRDELEAMGYNVIMSRETDIAIDLSDRPKEANALRADIFVGIHYNSMGGAGTARGIETFIYHRVASGFGQETNRNNFRTDDPRIDESLRLADAIHDHLIAGTPLRDRGVKGNNFNVLRNTEIPAMLTELGFLDNPTERALVNTRAYQESAAKAMAKGIDAYFRRTK